MKTAPNLPNPIEYFHLFVNEVLVEVSLSLEHITSIAEAYKKTKYKETITVKSYLVSPNEMALASEQNDLLA